MINSVIQHLSGVEGPIDAIDYCISLHSDSRARESPVMQSGNDWSESSLMDLTTSYFRTAVMIVSLTLSIGTTVARPEFSSEAKIGRPVWSLSATSACVR